MKKLATFVSSIFDLAVFVMFLVIAGFAGYIAVVLFGAGADVAGTETNVGDGELENALVNGLKGTIAALPIILGVIVAVLAIVMVVFAILNVQSSIAGFGYIKNGGFETFKPLNRMRAAFGIDFFIGAVLVAAFFVFGRSEGYDQVSLVCIIGGVVALIGAFLKIPATREKINARNNPPFGNDNSPKNRWK